METKYDGPSGQLRVDEHKLEDPTIVLLRTENNGATYIDEGDYSGPQRDDAGITITFTDRKVVGAVVTELSDDTMRSSFKNGGGFAVRERAGRDDAGVDRVSFADGEKPDGMPGLLPRPIAFVLFTLVVNDGTGVHDLTVDQKSPLPRPAERAVPHLPRAVRWHVDGRS